MRKFKFSFTKVYFNTLNYHKYNSIILVVSSKKSMPRWNDGAMGLYLMFIVYFVSFGVVLLKFFVCDILFMNRDREINYVCGGGVGCNCKYTYKLQNLQFHEGKKPFFVLLLLFYK